MINHKCVVDGYDDQIVLICGNNKNVTIYLPIKIIHLANK